MLPFSDVMQIDTDGGYQVVHMRDGWYVVGHGCCFPVNDRIDGLDMIAQFEGDVPCVTWH